MWPNPQETANLVTFTEEILNRKLHFLCIVLCLGGSLLKLRRVFPAVHFVNKNVTQERTQVLLPEKKLIEFPDDSTNTVKPVSNGHFWDH